MTAEFVRAVASVEQHIVHCSYFLATLGYVGSEVYRIKSIQAKSDFLLATGEPTPPGRVVRGIGDEAVGWVMSDSEATHRRSHTR